MDRSKRSLHVGVVRRPGCRCRADRSLGRQSPCAVTELSRPATRGRPQSSVATSVRWHSRNTMVCTVCESRGSGDIPRAAGGVVSVGALVADSGFLFQPCRPRGFRLPPSPRLPDAGQPEGRSVDRRDAPPLINEVQPQGTAVLREPWERVGLMAARAVSSSSARR